MIDTPVCRRCNGDGEVAEDGKVWVCGACDGTGYAQSSDAKDDEVDDGIDYRFTQFPVEEEEEYDWEGDAR